MNAPLEITIFHPTLASSHLPPLPPNGGGFFYIKRESDGMVLMDGVGWYMEFETQGDALSFIATELRHLGVGFFVRYMPKMRTH